MSSDFTTSMSPDSLAALGEMSGTILAIFAIVAIFFIVVYWKLFAKANKPGWAAIIPIYNNYVLAKIVFGNGWLFLLMIIPIVNVIYQIVLAIKTASVFGKGAGFGIGILFLPIIFLPVLAFGSSEYVGPKK